MSWFSRTAAGAARAPLLVVSILLLATRVASGAEPAFTPDCGADNLLARKAPIEVQAIHNSASLLTDEHVAPEGAQWDSPVAVIFDLPSAAITYDLGRPF